MIHLWSRRVLPRSRVASVCACVLARSDSVGAAQLRVMVRDLLITGGSGGWPVRFPYAGLRGGAGLRPESRGPHTACTRARVCPGAARGQMPLAPWASRPGSAPAVFDNAAGLSCGWLRAVAAGLFLPRASGLRGCAQQRWAFTMPRVPRRPHGRGVPLRRSVMLPDSRVGWSPPSAAGGAPSCGRVVSGMASLPRCRGPDRRGRGGGVRARHRGPSTTAPAPPSAGRRRG